MARCLRAHHVKFTGFPRRTTPAEDWNFFQKTGVTPPWDYAEKAPGGWIVANLPNSQEAYLIFWGSALQAQREG